jgi:hypothetical protein
VPVFRKTFLLLLSLFCGAAAETIQLVDGVFKVEGIRKDRSTKDWTPVFAVYAGRATTAMLGTYEFASGVLKFHPRFPLASGVRYRAVFHLSGTAPIEAFFDGAPRPAESKTRVEHIFPSADLLPANILKLYIVFSAPMSRGQAWSRIHLLDQEGKPVDGAFLEIDQELWDPQMRRITVLFDPGRIKRDLAPNLQMGLPLIEGRKYTVAVDREFMDARGAPLADSSRKAFRAGPVDRAPLEPTAWRIVAPQAGTRNELRVELPKPLDSALLRRTIKVHGPGGAAAGDEITGAISIGRDETEWSFTPSTSWKRGSYRLSIDNTLEDVAGNRPGRAFDRNEGDREKSPRGGIRVPFEIR